MYMISQLISLAENILYVILVFNNISVLIAKSVNSISDSNLRFLFYFVWFFITKCIYFYTLKIF